MPTIEQVKTQIENANALGRQNLKDKGVSIEETATTYEIMSKISEITAGEAETSLADMVYNRYGVSKEEYPYLDIRYIPKYERVYIYFTKSIRCVSGTTIYTNNLSNFADFDDFANYSDVDGAAHFACGMIKNRLTSRPSWNETEYDTNVHYINFNDIGFAGTVYNI
jgi:hypothetical protein